MKTLFVALLFLPALLHGQIITTVAGTGFASYSADGIPATNAHLNSPASMMTDPAGNLYITDYNNSAIRKVDAAGIMTTLAGTGTPGYSGDGGVATAAMLNNPCGITRDAAGNIYFCDYANHVVRKINAATNIITTIAGTGISGYNGDGIAATMAKLSYPVSVVLDASGNIYITDANNQRIRKINASGTISTIAGIGTLGFSGDGGQATAAAISNPFGIALDEAGNIYISDQTNHRIRKIVASGIISTIAGTGVVGYSGDGSAATAAKINTPTQINIDTGGYLLIAERHSNCVRRVKLSTGIITTLAGTGTAGYSGDGGPATAAQFNVVPGVYADGTGIVYIADFSNHRIRKIAPAPVSIATTPQPGNHFNIYPNPANDELIISATNGQIRTLTITNLLGQSMHSLSGINRPTTTINIVNLPAGTYMLHINGTETRQFIKK